MIPLFRKQSNDQVYIYAIDVLNGLYGVLTVDHLKQGAEFIWNDAEISLYQTMLGNGETRARIEFRTPDGGYHEIWAIPC